MALFQVLEISLYLRILEIELQRGVIHIVASLGYRHADDFSPGMSESLEERGARIKIIEVESIVSYDASDHLVLVLIFASAP